MQWYYSMQGRSVGPLSEDDFQKLVFSAAITPQTLVWREGMPEWAPYGTLNQAAAAGSAGSAHAAEKNGTCCECGREFPTDDLIKYGGSLVCAACKPVFFQRLQEGAALPGIFEYASFGTRFGAKFLDGIIVGIVNVVLSFVSIGYAASVATTGKPNGSTIAVQVAVWLVQMTISMAYYVGFHGKYGATPGKMVCKIKVVRADGSPITYGRACGRFFADMLSAIIMYIGYLMAAFDDEKRALHDRICDTRVIKC